MGCALYQPQSRSELWLDLGSFLFGFQKRGGGGQVKGVREHSQAKLSKFGSYFGPILLSLVAPCCFLKVHRVVNFYFWTGLNVLQGFFQGRSLLEKLIRQQEFIRNKGKRSKYASFCYKINGSQCTVHVYTQPDQNMLKYASFGYEKCLKKWSYFWALEK